MALAPSRGFCIGAFGAFRRARGLCVGDFWVRKQDKVCGTEPQKGRFLSGSGRAKAGASFLPEICAGFRKQAYFIIKMLSCVIARLKMRKNSPGKRFFCFCINVYNKHKTRPKKAGFVRFSVKRV